MIKALICDFDGTLCDTRAAISRVLLETYRYHAAPEPSLDAIEATLAGGVTLEETFGALSPNLFNDPDLCATWVQVYRQIYNDGLGIRSSKLFPNVPELLSSLKEAGVAVVIVSNKGEAAVWNTLRYFNIDGLISGVVAAKDKLATKPDPASFSTRILPLFPRIAPHEFLVFGDTTADIRYARAIGAPVAWAAYGYGEDASCRPLSPDAIIDEAAQLLQLIHDRNGSHPSTTSISVEADIDTLDQSQNLQGPFRLFCDPSSDQTTTRRAIDEITRHLFSAIPAHLTRIDLVVPIARAGVAMLDAAVASLDGPAVSFAIGVKNKGTGDVRVELSTGPASSTSILVLDTVVATGDTVACAGKMLRARYPNAEISLATCYASPEALTRIEREGLYRHVFVAVRSSGCIEGWLSPPINGDAGERLFGTTAPVVELAA
ncbi:HAD hydrolase-like protein [Sphingobium sp.]|uniref:HAD hydrolase-like protein n=1 Tax=Sphingobium sp. TaxID=1912891 RepID=UPI000DB41C6E|nr:HAD hydrolase-like protein [Sphingobium sp.]PZU68650.1 MAG: hypothetical protein DI540_07830 [Sphingobium sp.]